MEGQVAWRESKKAGFRPESNPYEHCMASSTHHKQPRAAPSIGRVSPSLHLVLNLVLFTGAISLRDSKPGYSYSCRTHDGNHI